MMFMLGAIAGLIAGFFICLMQTSEFSVLVLGLLFFLTLVLWEVKGCTILVDQNSSPKIEETK